MATAAEVEGGASSCAELVRAGQGDRYLAALFAPPAAREALFALYAFDGELARVRAVVTQAMAGLIRLQWWRDALVGVEAGQPLAHPVVEGLARVWPALRPQRHRLEEAIDGRERELDEEPFRDLAELERHVESTSVTITAAALEVLSAGDEHSRAAGREVGLACGIVDLVRRSASETRTAALLPARPEPAHGRRRSAATAVEAMAIQAGEHLRIARARHGALDRRALPVLLQARLTSSYLRRLERAHFDPRAPTLLRPAPLAPLMLAWHHWRRRL